MEKLDYTFLKSNQAQALRELRQKLVQHFEIDSLVLFGSIVRGEADDESDIDLLVLTARKLDRTSRHEITDIVFDINLRYNTNFSTLVVDSHTWNNGPISVLPIRDDVISEGMLV